MYQSQKHIALQTVTHNSFNESSLHKFIKHLIIGVNEEVSRSISNSPDNSILRWCRGRLSIFGAGGRRGRSGMDGREFPKIAQIARAILSAGIAELQSAQAHRCGNPILSHTNTQSWAGGTETLSELAGWPQPYLGHYCWSMPCAKIGTRSTPLTFQNLCL